MTYDNLVTVQNVTKTFSGMEHSAVSNISFTLAKGQILALLGPNGAGKTTTIKMLLGLILPSNGTVEVLGHNMAVASEMRRGIHHIGAVLEGARNAYWRLSALENLRYFGGLRGLSGNQADKRAHELLSMLWLLEQKDQQVRKFSRGMQQKCAIANALMHDPDILVLDEPTLGLDVQAAKVVEKTIVELSQQGKGILLTTHVMSLAERLSDDVLVINKGVEVTYDHTATLLHQFGDRSIAELLLKNNLPLALQKQLKTRFPALVFKTDQNQPKIEWAEPEQHQVILLFTILDQANCEVLSINRRKLNLEEIFLELTQIPTSN